MSIVSENAKRIASADKRLGQNFILDTNITRKIVSYADIGAADTVLEIGPGPGGLTLAILEKKTKQLIVIEKDPRCLPGLEELVRLYASGCKVEIVHGDALRLLESHVTRPPHENADDMFSSPVTIIANLPYNIASPLLIQFVHLHTHIKEMVLMFQKEVAQRIVAKPGTKAYGRLSIITQAFFQPTIAYHLPPSVFTPPPKVDSAVVRFVPLTLNDKYGDSFIKSLEHITQIFFSSRRKTIGHIIKKNFASEPSLQEFLQPYLHLRPENLDVKTYIDMVACLDKILK